MLQKLCECPCDKMAAKTCILLPLTEMVPYIHLHTDAILALVRVQTGPDEQSMICRSLRQSIGFLWLPGSDS